MLDSTVKPYIEKPINNAAKALVEKGFTPAQITMGGFIIGVLAAFAAGMQWYLIGLILVILNRLSDELDDAAAKIEERTQFGVYLDVITNFIFYGLVVLMVGMGTGQNLGAAFVLFCFMGMSSTYFASVILGTDQKEVKTSDGITFSPGSLVEGTETSIYLLLIFLFPGAFAAISMIFGFMCLVTMGGRIMETRDQLTGPSKSEKSEDLSE